MKSSDGHLLVPKQWCQLFGFSLLISFLASSCCCHPPYLRSTKVAQPEKIKERYAVPSRRGVTPLTPSYKKIVPLERDAQETPIENGVPLKPPSPEKLAPEKRKTPQAPKEKISRVPYDTTREDLLVVPFTEMCIITLKKEEEESGIDWGFITPWLYKD